MSLEELDQRLIAWEERLRLIDDNLLELESDPTYQALTSPARTKLEGVTAARIGPSLDAVRDLFDARQKLRSVLDEAREIRASCSPLAFWGTDDKIAQIEALLRGPSIHAATRVLPLARRNLLDKASREVAIGPEELVRTMTEAFESARDAIVQVASAWNALDPAMDRIEAEVAHLQKEAGELGEQAAKAELGPMAGELAILRGKVARDPLGVAGEIDRSTMPRLSAARQHVEALMETRLRAIAILARAGELRAEMAQARHAARHAEAHADREFAPAPPLGASVSDDAMAGLDAWRAKLDAAAGGRRFGPVEIGGGRLVETLEAYLTQDRAVAAVYENLVARRAELVGRLSARRAQAQALASRGANVGAAAALHAGNAEQLLTRRPTPLDPAAREVEAFERAVVEASHGEPAR